MSSKAFKVPHHEFGPAPFFTWMGLETRESIDRDLQRFLDMEIYEVIIFPIYGLLVEYMSEEYMQLFRHACERCKEFGMKIWIYDEFNWPAGVCAGKVLEKYPEAAQTHIKFSWEDEGRKTGNVTWAIETNDQPNLASMGSPWCKPMRGFLDILNKDAVKRFMETTHEVYQQEIGEYFGNTVIGFFVDEPTIKHAGGTVLPYTNGLFDKFHKKYGYQLEEKILSLVIDDNDSIKVRNDYWKLISDLFIDSYFIQVDNWCKENKLKISGHMIFEESLSSSLQNNADMYQVLASMDIPGIDLLTSGTSYDEHKSEQCLASIFRSPYAVDVTCKMLDSVVRFANKERSICEAFGCSPHYFNAFDLKRGADFLLHYGLSIINDNLFATSNAGMRKMNPCHSFWTPWVKHYNLLSRHMTSLSYLNSGAHLSTNLCVFYPRTDTVSRFGSPGTVLTLGSGRINSIAPHWERTQQFIYNVSHALNQKQWPYYYTFEQVIAESTVADGCLEHSDFECKVIIMPAIHYIDAGSAEKLVEFVIAGGKIICLDREPQTVDESGKVTTYISEQVANQEAKKNIMVMQTGLEINALAQLLDETISKFLTKKIKISGLGSENVLLTHRVKDNCEFAFLTNFGRSTVELKHHFGDEWYEVDTISREFIAKVPSKIKLLSDQSLLLMRSSNENVFDPGKPKDKILLGGKWQISEELENTYSMPVKLYKGNTESSGPPPLNDANEWSQPFTEIFDENLDSDKEYYLANKLILCYQPERLLISVDGEDEITVYVNGRKATEKVDRIVWDKDNISYDITELVKPGENVLHFSYKFSYARESFVAAMPELRTDITPFILVGDFLLLNDNPAQISLKGKESSISVGNLYERGFPHFMGELALEKSVEVDTDFKTAILDLGSQHDCFEVFVNGEFAGVLSWQPYILDIGKFLKKGTNCVKLRLLTSQGGIFQRRYVSLERAPGPLGLLDTPTINFKH